MILKKDYNDVEIDFFGTIQRLSILKHNLEQIKINNSDDFIDYAEEFKSIYQPLRDIVEINTKFEEFYIELLKILDKLQNEQLKQSIQLEKTKNEAKKALEKGAVNNQNYNPST